VVKIQVEVFWVVAPSSAVIGHIFRVKLLPTTTLHDITTQKTLT